MESDANMFFSGRVWKFADDINTDVIMPIPAMFKPRSEQGKYCMAAIRPGWSDEVQKGDILIAGRNFGTGSGRPGARVLRDLGISCLLAETINGLFFRNCVNYSLPALEVPTVSAAFEEGDTAEVAFLEGTVRNARTGEALKADPWPEVLLKILTAGGVLNVLENEGLIRRGARPGN